MFEIQGVKPLSKYNEGSKMLIRNPDNTPAVVGEDKTQLYIVLRSRFSDAAKAAQWGVQDERMKAANRGVRQDLNSAMLFQDQTDSLVACVVGWNLIGADGQPIDCTRDNADKLFSNPLYAHIREQAQEFVNTNANFT